MEAYLAEDCNKNKPVVLLLTKIDTNERQIYDQDVKDKCSKLLEEHKNLNLLGVYKVSAKNGENIDLVVSNTVKNIHESLQQKQETTNCCKCIIS